MLPMDRLRVLSASVLVPVSIFFAYVGGPLYVLFTALVVFLAAREYVQLFQRRDFRPSMPLVVGGALIFVAGAYLTSQRGHELLQWYTGYDLGSWRNWAYNGTLLLLLAAMTWHVVDHERGAPYTASDWAFTIAGALYLGIFAAHSVLLREDLGLSGRWAVLVVLPVQWVADSAAMMIGRRYGRHKLAPRLSPGKTWEGYVAGVIGGLLAGIVFGAIAGALSSPGFGIEPAGANIRVNWLTGLMVGVLCGLFTPLGDLGESLFKRQVQVKDSSNLVPGHGGVLDRTDSQLWACVIAYYFFAFFVRR